MIDHGKSEKAQLEGDQAEGGFVGEMKYWWGLLRRLGEEGSEDARKFVRDIDEMIKSGEDQEAIQRHFIAGLLRSVVVLGYERPVTAANTENFNMRMPVQLLEKIDCAILAGAARNRSEFLRNMLELLFSGVDASQMRYRVVLLEVMRVLMENPEEVLLFYLVRSFFNRPDVGSVAKMLLLIANPLSEIVAAVGGEGIERVKQTLNELFETLNTANSESEDAARNPE